MNEEETWHSDWVRLYEMLGNDFLYPDPFNHIVFPDNHDMSRVHTQLGDEAWKTRLAMVFFATTRGIPQFYYGTEILMSNTGDDSHGNIRSDFPGGWLGDEINGFTGQDLSPEATDFQAFTRQLLNWRQTSGAVHNGRLIHFAPEGSTYVYFRKNDSGTVMVILNKSEAKTTLDLGRFDEVLTRRRAFKEVLGDTAPEIIQDQLTIPGNTAWILEVH